MADEVSERRRAQKHSEDAEANEIIEALRNVAQMIVNYGNSFHAMFKENEAMRSQISSMEEVLARCDFDEETHQSWEELLLDFRSGVRDKDELLAGTVGK